ncbi:hypothetical protein WME75_45565 [Sorangium sp. So ce1014]|uniref:hypothetical protein n=1 Tax=Sorangium sp. So ce1014 TaxID=3133326 RepID=UPI003F631456
MAARLQLQARVIRILDRVVRDAPIEDSYVELKRQWPDATEEKRYDFTRQIAAHANAAGGTDILWIIGAHDKSASVEGAKNDELAVWLDIFKSHFEGLAPDLLESVVVEYGNVSVVALRFDTSMAPYVLKGLKSKEMQRPAREVAWREGTSARTARREDLIRMLAPIETMPIIELIYCALDQGGYHNDPQIGLLFEMYVYTKAGQRVTFPLHKCAVAIGSADSVADILWVPMRITRIVASLHRDVSVSSRIDSKTVIESASETIVVGSGMVTLGAHVGANLGKWGENIEVEVSMWALEAERSIRLRETLIRSTNPRTKAHEWVMKQHAGSSPE